MQVILLVLGLYDLADPIVGSRDRYNTEGNNVESMTASIMRVTAQIPRILDQGHAIYNREWVTIKNIVSGSYLALVNTNYGFAARTNHPAVSII